MQDDFLKNNKDLDAEFVDSAWNDMHALLDVEMPIEKPTRRFFFWWFPLGAVGMLLLTIWAWNLSTESSPKNIKNDIQIAERKIDGPSMKLEPNVIIKKPNSIKTIEKNPIQKNKKSKSVILNNVNRNPEIAKLKIPNKMVLPIDKSNNEIVKNDALETDHQVTLEPIEIGDYRIPTSTSQNMCYGAPDYEKLKNKPVFSEIETETKNIDLTPKYLEIKKINPFQFGLFTGINLFPSNKIGFSIGGNIDFKLSKLLSLSTGAEFRQFSSVFYTKKETAFNDQFDKEENNVLNSPTKNYSSQNDFKQIENMIVFPLQIKFSLHPRWKLSSGMQYEASLSKVKAQQFAYIGEVDFNFNRHLYLGLKYSKALSKTKLPNFGVGLKLGYRF